MAFDYISRMLGIEKPHPVFAPGDIVTSGDFVYYRVLPTQKCVKEYEKKWGKLDVKVSHKLESGEFFFRSLAAAPSFRRGIEWLYSGFTIGTAAYFAKVNPVAEIDVIKKQPLPAEHASNIIAGLETRLVSLNQ